MTTKQISEGLRSTLRIELARCAAAALFPLQREGTDIAHMRVALAKARRAKLWQEENPELERIKQVFVRRLRRAKAEGEDLSSHGLGEDDYKALRETIESYFDFLNNYLENRGHYSSMEEIDAQDRIDDKYDELVALKDARPERDMRDILEAAVGEFEAAVKIVKADRPLTRLEAYNKPKEAHHHPKQR